MFNNDMFNFKRLLIAFPENSSIRVNHSSRVLEYSTRVAHSSALQQLLLNLLNVGCVFRKIKQPSAATIARNMMKARREIPSLRDEPVDEEENVMQQIHEEKGKSGQSSRGVTGSEPEEVVELRIARRNKRATTLELGETDDSFTALKSMRFHGTRYPHLATMEALGITEEVTSLLKAANLQVLLTYHFPAYQSETCQFLSTLKVASYADHRGMISDGSHKFIYFRVDGTTHTLSFNQINALFEFEEGSGMEPDYSSTELMKLWETLGGRTPFKTSQVKSSDIRNPSLRYFHRIVASTIFAKKNTGAVNDQELQTMDSALKDFILYATPGDMERGIIMRGDRNGAGNAEILVTNLVSYKAYATKLHRMHKEGDLTIGGLVTPILLACGIDLTMSDEFEPEWLDISHLQSSRILGPSMVDDQYVYNFLHPHMKKAKILLPCPDMPKLTEGESADFVPPLDFLYMTRVQRDAVAEVEESLPEPERYDFDEEVCTNLGTVSKKLTLTRRWSKWQDKTITKLKGKVKELTSAVTDLTKSVKELQVVNRPQPPAYPPIDDRSLARTHSFTHQRRQATSSQPRRRSSVEDTREGRRTYTQTQLSDDEDVPPPQPTRVLHPSRALESSQQRALIRPTTIDVDDQSDSNRLIRRRQPRKLTRPSHSGEPAESSYTHASMDNYLDDYFTPYQ